MAQRLEAAKLLLGGSTYDQIVKAVEIKEGGIETPLPVSGPRGAQAT